MLFNAESTLAVHWRCRAPNPLLWQQKVGLHPERVKNLYFTYLFVTRAVSLSLPSLLHYNYSTGDVQKEEAVTFQDQHGSAVDEHDDENNEYWDDDESDPQGQHPELRSQLGRYDQRCNELVHGACVACAYSGSLRNA